MTREELTEKIIRCAEGHGFECETRLRMNNNQAPWHIHASGGMRRVYFCIQGRDAPEGPGGFANFGPKAAAVRNFYAQGNHIVLVFFSTTLSGESNDNHLDQLPQYNLGEIPCVDEDYDFNQFFM